MTAPLTLSVHRLLDDAGRRAEPRDVYAGDGARFYDELVGPDRSEIGEVLAVARRSGPAVLDLAAGSGRVTLPLLRVGKSVTALDLSPSMLQRLSDALPPGAPCDLVVADMRAFDLGREFDLVVIAATSITLLDRDDRRRLFRAVRRHLAPTGTLLLSVAGDEALRGLRTSGDREISVVSGDRVTRYLQSQQVEPGGSRRVVNWMPLPLPAPPEPVPVLTTRLQLLDAATVAAELEQNGFRPPATIPVRSPGVADGEGMLLLRTGVDDGGAHDA